VLTHSASATVREAVLHTPPARLFCTASAPFEEGRRLAEDLRSESLDVELVELLKLAPIPSPSVEVVRIRDPSEPVMITSRDRSQAGIAKSPDQAPEGR
jgi:hypothetical protein